MSGVRYLSLNRNYCQVTHWRIFAAVDWVFNISGKSLLPVRPLSIFSAVTDLLSTWPKSTKLDNYLVIISKFLLWKYIWEYCSQNHCKSVQSPNDVKQDLFCKSACPRLPPRYISMMLSLVFMRFGGNAKPFVAYSLKLTFWLE